MAARIFICLFISMTTVFAEAPVSKSLFGSVAIGSKDTVAYHELAAGERAIKGAKSFSIEWHGATWRFASAQALNKFAAQPERYIPEFNGHCANALSLGEGLVKTDGTIWQFFNDRLYLFYAKKGLERWQNGDQQQYLQEAQAAWASLTSP